MLPSPRIAAVIVIYQCLLKDSKAYNSLVDIIGMHGSGVPLLIYDNSPVSQDLSLLQDQNVVYRHDPGNGGLVAAYNFALQYCQENDMDWILLLDQDTLLPRGYLDSFNVAFENAGERCVAFVPHVRINGRISSPKRFICRRPRLNVSAAFSGPSMDEIFAINSGTIAKVAHLVSRGGYPTSYWVDGVDFWFCADAYLSGKHLYVMDATVDHALSIRNMKEVSIERWTSIVRSEAEFTMQMRRSRLTRFAAAVEGVAYAGFLALSGHRRHARIGLEYSLQVGKSVFEDRQ